jgi:UDP-N-acetylmuramyl pentapeptide phosphotransferase/UDP-N-acetylglucosamine-1-phosphate transferase
MVRNLLGRLAIAAGGGYAAREAVRVLSLVPGAERLSRTNYRGHRVSLVGGPALTVGATAAAVAGAGAGSGPVAAAALVAGLGSGLVGGYDDLVGDRPRHAAKGFRGHVSALREGRVTSGSVKVLGVGAAALTAAALLPAPSRRGVSAAGRALDVALAAGVIAGTANLVNLLDLRPGRALKAGVLFGMPLAVAVARDDVAGSAAGLAAGAVGAAAGLLPADLDEEVMLGDAGANALGALLGTAYAARAGRAGRFAALVALVVLTVASEKVSYTRVIERTPVLRELDAFGRRPGTR